MNQPAEDLPTEKWRWQTSLLTAALKILAASWVIILLSVVIGVILAVQRLQGSPALYKVEALLIENTEPTSSVKTATSGTISLLGGGATSQPELDQFEVLLSSPEVAEIIDNKYHLVHQLYRGNWDSVHNRWRPHVGMDRLHNEIVEALGGTKLEDPSYYDLARYIGSNVTFQKGRFGSVMAISMVSDKPEEAKRMLTIVLDEVSGEVRSQMIAERQTYVNYLQQQLGQASLTSNRDALISILADEYRSLMVLESAKTFPLQEIQPPTRGEFPINKSVSLILMYGILEGLLVAGILVVCGVRDATLWRLFARLRFWRKN